MTEVVFIFFVVAVACFAGFLLGSANGKKAALMPATEKQLKQQLEVVVQNYIDEALTVIVKRVLAQQEKQAP